MTDIAIEPGRDDRPPVNLDADLAAMGLAELGDYIMRLREHRDSLLDARDDIDGQLGWAKSAAYARREYADPVWFRRANDARAHKERAIRAANRSLQEAERRRGELARAERTASSSGDNRAFIDAARLVLDKATYLAVWEMAERIKAARDGRAAAAIDGR